MIELFSGLRGKLLANHPLAPYTWLKVGGPAKLFFEPADLDDLKHFLSQRPADLRIFYMGLGSNLLIDDSGFNGVVIRLGKTFSFINSLDDTLFEVGAFTVGVLIAKYTHEHSLTGCEFFSHLPGSLGGAIKMNAGCFGQETKDIIESVTVLNPDGSVRVLSNTDCQFVYRNSAITNDILVLSAVLKCSYGDMQEIKRMMNEQTAKRNASQPVTAKTAGSFFKNPSEGAAAMFIDQCGLKGYTIGGAQVSLKHANFFENVGDASATDFLKLRDHVQQCVKEKFNIDLIPEVKYIK